MSAWARARWNRSARGLARVAGLVFFLAAPAVTAQGMSAHPAWGQTTEGAAVHELAPAAARALVLYFVATDCPISNRTFPEMRRLRERYAAQGVTFWYVYPNENETAKEVAAHQRDFDREGQALLARGPEIVRLAHAYATPEIVVLRHEAAGAWTPVYAGRVDNRFVKFGLERPQATEHYGDDAIAAVLAGRTPKPATGTIVGCAIMNAGARP